MPKPFYVKRLFLDNPLPLSLGSVATFLILRKNSRHRDLTENSTFDSEAFRHAGFLRNRNFYARIKSLQHFRRLGLLQQSGQLERLMRSGLRHCQAFAVLDAHAAGELEPVSVRRWGADLVFGRLWQESGIAEGLRSLLGRPAVRV